MKNRLKMNEYKTIKNDKSFKADKTLFCWMIQEPLRKLNEFVNFKTSINKYIQNQGMKKIKIKIKTIKVLEQAKHNFRSSYVIQRRTIEKIGHIYKSQNHNQWLNLKWRNAKNTNKKNY